MRIARFLPILLAFGVLLGIAPPPGRADEPNGGGEDGGDPAAPPEELDDKADDKVPFVEEVNRAIEQGTVYLLLRPYGPKQVPEVMKEGKLAGKQLPPFKVPTVGVLPGLEDDKIEGAHWGFVNAPNLYGDADGDQFERHPAGPTAFALYALLKCGEDPKHPLIQKGFNWLRQVHRVDKAWDDRDFKDRWWSHTVVGTSYELSSMILALTAKYDTHKRSKNTQAKRKQGKLKIGDKEERLWLEQMVELLVRRRGEPATKPVNLSRSDFERLGDYRKEKNLPPENPDRRKEDRLGWRYNSPAINLIKVRKSGKSTSTESMNRVNGLTAPGRNQDLSSTQLAALALFNAHQFGVKPPDWEKVWADIVQMTLEHQEKEGPEHKRFDPLAASGGYGYTPKIDHVRGFSYIPTSPENRERQPSGAMTACGVANLIMGRTLLLEDEDGRKEWDKRGFGKVDEKSKQNVVDKGIWDGLAWLDVNWSPFENRSGGAGYHIYYLYALERAMDLLGKNLVGNHLWYTEGAKEILSRQQRTKVKNPLERGREYDVVFWDTDSTHEPEDVLDTAFALLFLKRATKDIIPPPNVTGGDDAPTDNR
jgi:hypothetical protein